MLEKVQGATQLGATGEGNLPLRVSLPFALRRVLRRGSEKGVSRRYLERPLGEYDPSGVRPSNGNPKSNPQG